ncbi:MAG: DUF4870 domain-containing protein [Dehalococcoidia bacterium]|jgi:uncharacterized membrane protein|nr:DUF4870 domain-containing protein [Dehalococcoidia bacterium]
MAGDKTSMGLEQNIAGLLSYVLGWITGLVFFLLEKENKFVRFHAMQSIIVFGGLTVISLIISIIPLLGWVVSSLLSILALVLWILLMIKAYQNVWFKLPLVGDLAEKYSK